MQYITQVYDYDTGEVSFVDLGDHRPVTEVARELHMGPRKFREALAHMGVLQQEYDETARQFRLRLSPSAVKSGLGVRHDNKGWRFDPERSPFDVLSPLGVEYVRERLPETMREMEALPAIVAEALKALARFEATRLRPMNPQMRVCWLLDHYKGLTVTDISKAIGVHHSLVSRYVETRERQLKRPGLGHAMMDDHENQMARAAMIAASALRPREMAMVA